jgi:uncharacterized protein (DUF2141 family)
MMYRFTLLIVFLALFSPFTSQAVDLQINVVGLRSIQGEIHFGLFNRPEAFPKGESLAGTKVKVTSGSVTVVFTDLQPGTYAVSLYHDENSNGRFDKNFLGLPQEGYGFSNDARPTLLGPPSFTQASFTVDGNQKVITITVQY